MSSIYTNLLSLNLMQSMYAPQTNYLNAALQLSTGLRINSAATDTAGLAISQNLAAQINGLYTANRNVNDAISISQTADYALSQAQDILQEVRTLAVQSANDTYSGSDRAALQQQARELLAEYNSIAQNTNYNGIRLLNGNFSSALFQIGSDVGQMLGFTLDNVQSSAVGINTVRNNTGANTIETAVTGSSNAVSAQTLTINSGQGIANITVNAGDSASEIAATINNQTSITGVSANASTTATLSNLSANGTVSFNLGNGSQSTVISANISAFTDLSALSTAINNVSPSTGISAEIQAGALVLTNQTGENIQISNFSQSSGGTLDITGSSGAAVTIDAGNNTATVGGTLELNSSDSFVVNNNNGDTSILTQQNQGSSFNPLSGTNLSTQAGALSAINVIDGALDNLSNTRASIGAAESSFSSLNNNLLSGVVQLSSAYGRIQNTNYAESIATMTRSLLLQRITSALMGQANSNPLLLLNLLSNYN